MNRGLRGNNADARRYEIRVYPRPIVLRSFAKTLRMNCAFGPKLKRKPNSIASVITVLMKDHRDLAIPRETVQ